jgi:hypothetical protein
LDGGTNAVPTDGSNNADLLTLVHSIGMSISTLKERKQIIMKEITAITKEIRVKEVQLQPGRIRRGL